MARITVVIPTLARYDSLSRVLDRLDAQTAPAADFAVHVVSDAAEADGEAVRRAIGEREYRVSHLCGERAGASATRNAGWRAADTALVLFLDDDVLPEPALVAQHLEWHGRHPGRETGVLGLVRWADELDVTPFMRWLERGIQFDYGRIDGTEAGWGRFYTANVSVKRELLELAGGFEEEALPFGYEDLDLALRMDRLGFRLLYNRKAVAEHLHAMDLDFWRRRVARVAISERSFVRLHPGTRPYFHDLFSAAAARPAMRGRAVRLARWVPPGVPWLGGQVWSRADLWFRQQLAPHFLDAWRADEAGVTAPARGTPGTVDP